VGDILEIPSLSPCEKRIIGLRYGIYDNRPKQIWKVAELMCMTSEGVRIIMKSGLQKIKETRKS
jgi:DNA-directed RNA polymerase sigma subunit (sigma70/sigma32)